VSSERRRGLGTPRCPQAINRGLAKRLEQLSIERERRERAADKADAEFSSEFLSAAREVFQMIDYDDSGTLEKAEVVNAVRADKKVIDFLVNCGNKNLQYLLVPARLESALAQLDTDRDGHIDAVEWARRGARSHAPTRAEGNRPLTRHRSAGGGHRDGARQQARAARRGPRGRGQGGAKGNRRASAGVACA